MTASIPPAARRVAHAQVLHIGGAGPEHAWITVLDETGFPSLAMTIWHVTEHGASHEGGRLAAVGELRPGHWVGLPLGIGPMYLYDDTPSMFVSLDGRGPLPRVATDLRLFDVAWLGEGKVCGLGLVAIDGGFREELWSQDGNTPSQRVPLGMRDGSVDYEVVFRGEEGACRLLRSGRAGTTLWRLQGGSLTRMSVPFETDLATAAPDGALWFVDAHRRLLGRASVHGATVDVRTYALPEAQSGCDSFRDVTHLVAIGEDDAWAIAREACATADGGARADALLRTRAGAGATAATGAIGTWPAP